MEPFGNKIEENGMSYYVLSPSQYLFKATKQAGILSLQPGQLSFFGVKNMSPGYIEDYEEEYGVIFEFVTTREYKLLALDDQATQEKLYETAPPSIQDILERNYGFETGVRDSQSDPDRDLSMYLCKQGYDGYAIQSMRTDMGGTFHPEFMICDVGGIQYVGQITPPNRAQRIIDEAKMRRISDQTMLNRKKGRLSFSPAATTSPLQRVKSNSLFEDDENVSPPNAYRSPMSPPRSFAHSSSLFGSDDDDDDDTTTSRFGFGGKRRRRKRTMKKAKHYRKKGTTKKRKRVKRVKRRM